MHVCIYSLFSCLLVASKVWDDLSMWNCKSPRICIDLSY